ncbi:uncharacterized protein LOC143293889 isoform X3 [Babylonia areolata]
MDGDKASRFVSSLVKSIQALCNGYIDFSSSIEVIGHIHLNIDRSVKLDYVLTEEVSKSVSEGSTLFASHSYHSQPPSKSDSSSRNRQKQSAGVSQGDEGDSTFRSSSSEVHNTSSKSDSHSHRRSHYGENSVSSHTGSFVDTSDSVLVKQEHRQNMCQSQESLDRRRRNAPSQPQSHRSSSPAAKRSRQSDCNPEQDQNFEVIEIKEEPEDEPAVFFGNSSSHMAAGQDVQTPDFSNVVMESLDRVGQVEGTNLVASGDGGQMQQQPFPVMMHANSGMSSSSASSSAPGPLLSDPQSLASTSGTRHRLLKSSSSSSSSFPTTTTSTTTSTNNIINNSINNSNNSLGLTNESWDLYHEQYEQKRRDRAEAIQAAVDYVLQSGLPAYKVASMFRVSKTTLYRHLAQQVRAADGSSPGAPPRPSAGEGELLASGSSAAVDAVAGGGAVVVSESGTGGNSSSRVMVAGGAGIVGSVVDSSSSSAGQSQGQD